ncbi:MAG TPA: HAD-IB family hydrolase [Candidatus Thermoplasmatota archaeon]|nr:HAD-IB family hydrolase [Candidatus Thermoplasmatota archaeon]
MSGGPDAAGAGALPPMGTAAFFDFDHTLLHGDAGVIFGWTLAAWNYERGKDLPPQERRRYNAAVSAQIARTIGTGAVYKSLNAVGILKRSKLIELTYRFLEGLPAAEMSARMERVWNEKLEDLLYPKMREVIENHRKQGHRIAIVTTGMSELVAHSKRALGADIDIIGTTMRATDGIWEGRVDGPLYGVHKAIAVRDWAQKNAIDLAESYAYSDHYSDVAFLDVVGNPVAVNPDLRLRMHARKKGWPVLNVLPGARRQP